MSDALSILPLTFLGGDAALWTALARAAGPMPDDAGAAWVLLPDCTFAGGVSLVGDARPLRAALIETPQSVILLSSARIYGNGEAHCGDCGWTSPVRFPEQLAKRRWDPLCPICDEMLMPLPIPEDTPAGPISPRGESVRDTEDAVADACLARGLPLCILRLFHPVIPGWPDAPVGGGSAGPEVLSAWAGALRAGEPPVVYEDGNQLRAFTHAEDLMQAVSRAAAYLAWPDIPDVSRFNIASDDAVPLFTVAADLIEAFGRTDLGYTMCPEARPGDTRHRLADIRHAERTLGYRPTQTARTIARAWAAGFASARPDARSER